MLTLKNLSKRFKSKEVLHSINLRLDTKVYGLLGANGAGKTTLMRCMAGLYDPHKGRLLQDEQYIVQELSPRPGLPAQPLACSGATLL